MAAVSPTPIPKIAIQEEKEDASHKEWGKALHQEIWKEIVKCLHYTVVLDVTNVCYDIHGS